MAPSYDATIVVPDEGNGHGVVLYQEIFGVNEFLLAKAGSLAELGYVVLCPDVFWRVQPGVSLPHDEAALQEAFALAQRYGAEVADEDKVADLETAVAHLRSLPEVGGRGAGVLGFCLGGRLAYSVAARSGPDTAV